jgi:hypothetical protein
MLKTVLFAGVSLLPLGCRNLSNSGETKEFDLPEYYNYKGTPVDDCSQQEADRFCREFGYEKAIDYSCGPAVSGTVGFFVTTQDVMYCVTCWRD